MGLVTKAFATAFCQYWYLSWPIVLLTLFRIYNKCTAGIFKKNTRMDGKTVIITGANSGIGEATAHDLAARGARIIMACRDLGKANGVRAAIVEKTKNPNVFVRKLDLSSLDSVREFAAGVLEQEKHIHVLINNAGQAGFSNKITKDGLQLCMEVNHFGPFLLTNLLLGRIRDSAPSRIINVSSVAHRMTRHKLNVEDLNYTKDFHDWITYCHSKLCNILTTNYLTKLLEGTGVTANSLNPGVVHTPAFSRIKDHSPIRHAIVMFILGTFYKSPQEGAQTTIYAAVDPDLENVSGKYFQDCRESRCISAEALDMTLAEQMWEKSVEMVKLTKSELNY